MDYQNIRQRTSQFESVTGLKVEEFDYLNQHFLKYVIYIINIYYYQN